MKKVLTHKSTSKKQQKGQGNGLVSLTFFSIIMSMKTLIQQDYSKFPRNYQLKICSDLDVLLLCDESVRLLSEVVEQEKLKAV